MTGTGVAAGPGRPLRRSDPTELGPYRLLRRLGEGGMGSVYLAQSLAGGRLVALKVIRHDLVNDPDFRRRFRSEVARAQQVPAFCTAEVLAADPDHDPPYLVVEYVNGPSLARVVADQGPLSPSNLHGLAIGVATSLAAIHGAGVIHRDLKPANVLLALGSPKVIDFGIARGTEGTGLTDTNTSGLLGTIAYMAPERLDSGLGLPLTQAADIFAWGAVVTFAGTGNPPFGNGAIETAARILTQPPNLAGLTGDLRELVERSLAKNPADRPTAKELLDHLVAGGARQTLQLIEAGSQQAVVTVSSTSDTTRLQSPARTLKVKRPRRRSRLLAAALTLILVGAATVLAGYFSGVFRPTATAEANDSRPSATASPVPGGKVVLDESLAKESVWFKSNKQFTTPGLMTDCVVDGGLTVTRAGRGTFRCPSYVNFYRDFLVEVDVKLHSADSCAGLWFRFSGDGEAGYLLMICEDRYMVGTHNDNEGGLTFFKTVPLPHRVTIGVAFRVGVRAVGDSMSLTFDGVELEKPFAHHRYQTGKILMGIAVSQAAPAHPTYEVSFRNVRITEVAAGEGSGR